MKLKGKYIKYLIPAIVLIILAIFFTREESETGKPRDYAEIKKSKILRVVTEYNSLSYYVDGDTISGFQYELINAFAKDKGLRLDITPEMSFDKRLKGLSNGKFDIIAYNIPVTTELKDSILLTTPIVLNKQVLVQRKAGKSNPAFIKSQLDLAHKILHVEKGSPSILRIKNLSNEIGEAIYIKEVEKYGSEQLMALVAHGNISYAVCDQSIALASIDSFPQLDIHTDISFTQFYSWGVSKHSPVLLDTLNSWLKEFTKSEEYKRIYKKYYKG
ncbi:extracellular solute-binding protein, family 3 [Bacteroides luti]|jgi:Predicted soluble lytic transglycosylase fused to an ABC-type amino acid-binding protein|uniref:Extracellular solute-binding protein, family 3 n=1 Tax=Bacteroides luti TaxID=1297750 RepID=A0A1M5CI23_9BACE|nr:transporter substrate-binding domain-containing protein [Bacteroides luti]SHF54330.1 extracellular solute-binding protein, family 3 [Bacteroides luti]